MNKEATDIEESRKECMDDVTTINLKWNCGVCTYSNSMENGICEVCQMGTQSSSANHPLPPSSSNISHHEQKSMNNYFKAKIFFF